VVFYFVFQRPVVTAGTACRNRNKTAFCYLWVTSWGRRNSWAMAVEHDIPRRVSMYQRCLLCVSVSIISRWRTMVNILVS